MPTVFGHRCWRPARQLRQWPQTMWPSAETRWPTLVAGDAGAQLDDAADELVADHQARLDRALAPLVPHVDVQVGAADRGLLQLDQHVVRAGRGHRHLFHPDAFGGFALDQRLHRLGHRCRSGSCRFLGGSGPGWTGHGAGRRCYGPAPEGIGDARPTRARLDRFTDPGAMHAIHSVWPPQWRWPASRECAHGRRGHVGAAAAARDRRPAEEGGAGARRPSSWPT